MAKDRKTLVDRVSELGRACLSGVADAARTALQDEASRARGDLVASLWDDNPTAAAESYRLLGEPEPGKLIELAMTIVEAVPILQRFANVAPEGPELADRLRENARALRSTPPREAARIDEWLGACECIERQARDAHTRWTWADAARTYLARTANRFPALADDPRWSLADDGPVTADEFDQARRLWEKTTSQELPTRLVDGVLRSVAPPPPRRRVRVKSA